MRALALLACLAAPAAAQDADRVVAERAAEMRGEDEGRRKVASEALARMGAAAIPALEGLAREEAWEVRQSAAWALAEIGGKAAQPALERLAADAVWAVRAEAARGLSDGAAVGRAARDPVWRVRAAAASAPGADESTLRDLLADREKDVRARAASAIAASGRPGFRRDLATMLGSPETRDAGLDLFRRIARPDDEAAIRPLFSDPDPALRVRALRAAADAGCDVAGDIENYVRWVCDLHGSTGEELRRTYERAADALNSLGPAAIPALEKATDGSASSLAVVLGTALARTGDRRAAPGLAKLLRHEDLAARFLGFSSLLDLDPREAERRAPDLLGDPAVEMRVLAIQALSATKEGRSALRGRWDELKDADRLRALEAIARDDDGETRALVRGLLDDRDASVRRFANAWAARTADGAQSAELRERFLREQDDSVRAAILAGIARAPRGHEELLAAAVDDRSHEVRQLAVGGLAARGDPALAHTIRKALLDPHWPVRIRAVEALGDALTAEEIFEAATDPSHDVRAAAVRAAARRGGAGAVPALVFTAAAAPAGIRIAAAEGVARLPESMALAVARAIVLADPDPFVRAAAARAAARFPAAIEFVAAAARSEKSAAARAALLSAASDAARRSARTLLAPFAADPDPDVRAAVAAGLGRFPDPADATLLARLAGDPNRGVRLAAAGALVGTPGEEASKALWTAAGDAEGSVRREALSGLARRGETAAVKARLAGDDEDALYDVADALAAAGRPAEALDVLTARGAIPRSAWPLAGWCALDLGAFDHARLWFTAAAAAGEPPESGWHWALLARALGAAREGRPEAEPLVRLYVDRAGPPAEAASNAAFLLAESLVLDTIALALATDATAGPIPSADALDTLGWVHLRGGRPADADRVLSALPRPPGASGWYHRAVAQAAAGRPEEAAGSLREALSREPGLRARARAETLLAPLFDRPELEAWK